MNQTSEFRLMGARDEVSGHVFFPPRALSADGALRPLQNIILPAVGVLHSYARMGEIVYGLIDLAGGVRLHTELAGDEHTIGAEYHLAGEATGWWFARA